MKYTGQSRLKRENSSVVPEGLLCLSLKTIFRSLFRMLKIKETLFDRRYGEPFFIYLRFFGMTIPFSELFCCDASLWNQYKFITFKIVSLAKF